MSEFDTKHKNYALRYNVDDGVWYCPELDLRATQLKSLRALIDRDNLEKRRVNLPALWLHHEHWRSTGDGGHVQAVIITTLIDDRECWIKTAKGDREKEYLSNLYEDTPETKTAFLKWREALAEAKDANLKAATLKEAIPRVKVPSIKAPTDASA